MNLEGAISFAASKKRVTPLMDIKAFSSCWHHQDADMSGEVFILFLFCLGTQMWMELKCEWRSSTWRLLFSIFLFMSTIKRGWSVPSLLSLTRRQAVTRQLCYPLLGAMADPHPEIWAQNQDGPWVHTACMRSPTVVYSSYDLLDLS